MLQDIRRQKLDKSGSKFRHGGRRYQKWPKQFRRLLWTAPYTENEQCDLQFTMILQICQTKKYCFFFLGNSNNVGHFRKFQSLPSENSPKLFTAMKVAGCFAQCGSMRNQVESKPLCSHSTVKHFCHFLSLRSCHQSCYQKVGNPNLSIQ